MPIPQAEIANASVSYSFSASANTAANSIYEARAKAIDTAFLCHSHKDAALAERMQDYFTSKGWRVYIDWKDASMPETPNRETASKIQGRIRECKWFLFLATANSMSSKWCPWELGYSDGVKGKDFILIIPTSNPSGVAFGSEYMELYRRIDYTKGNPSELKRIDVGNLYTGTELSAM